MYRAGIVGCGRIASGFDEDPLRKHVSTHAGAYRANQKIDLTAAADIDKNKLVSFGKKWGVNSLYTDYGEMLIKEHLDILSICTWSSTHYEIAEKAVEDGVKAIFCEKPITSKLSDADQIVKLCEEKSVVLAVDHQRRWDILHQKIKKFIDDGGIGDIQQITFYYTAGIASTGSHMFDLLRYFFGDVNWVCGFFKNRGLGDPSIDGYLRFKNGISATIQSCDARNFLIFEMDVLGSKGRLRTANSGNSAELFKVRDSKFYSGYKELSQAEIFKPERKEFMLRAVEDIVKCVEQGGVPLCSGEDGRKALELSCSFYESAMMDGKKIYLPLKNRNIEIKSR